jgi:hypothetical protein
MGGASGSENVGTSNRKEGEIPSRRNTKVSFAMTISEGLVGPKEMVKTGSDGHMVNIPWLVYDAMEWRSAVLWADNRISVHAVRKTFQENPEVIIPSGVEMRRFADVNSEERASKKTF